MRLVDLEPRWLGGTYSGPSRFGCGITFECPVHRTHRLGVKFANPLDGGDPLPDEVGAHRWQRTGETFETLTLSPSIDASATTQYGGPCWHGFITNGEVT